jgi:hypothetical protein
MLIHLRNRINGPVHDPKSSMAEIVSKKKDRVISSECRICKATRLIDYFPGLPCCCTSEINEEVCCSCLVAALTKPTDNKCPRCREFVTLASSHVNDKPPWDVLSVEITLGVIDQCYSCGEKKRLKPPNNICVNCQKEKEKSYKGLQYECQVCHGYQSIPYPLYKSQPSPQQYGNSKRWVCQSKMCGGNPRRWRIVDSEIKEIQPGAAPHAWAQYFIRRNLNKLPPNPAVYKTEAKLLQDLKFQVETVSDDGKSFLVPSIQFPIAIGPEDDNADWAALKTTLRVRNGRTNTIGTILAHRFSGLVQGRYIAASDGDFQAGDWLEALDYVPLVPSETFLLRREFSIEKACTLVPDDDTSPEQAYSETREFGWQLQPYNIRIGKIGLVGHEFHNVWLNISVDKPVSTLWTDAVDILVEFSTVGNAFVELKQNHDAPSLRDFPTGPIAGSLYLKFHSINLDTLGGLVSTEFGGGLHIAVLGPSDDDDKVETVEALEHIKADNTAPESPTVPVLQEKILEMPLSEKRKRFFNMIEHDSQRAMFAKNVDGDDVDSLLKEMVKNEDFVRRFLRESTSIDGFGWVSDDNDEDLRGSSLSQHSDRWRWSVVFGPDDIRVIVDDGEEKSQIYVSPRASRKVVLPPIVMEDLEIHDI